MTLREVRGEKRDTKLDAYIHCKTYVNFRTVLT